MSKAWIFQDHREKKMNGAKAGWSVGWIDDDGRRRSKRIGPRYLARRTATIMTINGFREPPEISKKLLKRSGGFVYFVEALGLDMVKIGSARDVDHMPALIAVDAAGASHLFEQGLGVGIGAVGRRAERAPQPSFPRRDS